MGRCAIGSGDGNFLRAGVVYRNINKRGSGVSTECVLDHAACPLARLSECLRYLRALLVLYIVVQCF
jgi:hypothetical protein